jgi:hypothetical protein
VDDNKYTTSGSNNAFYFFEKSLGKLKCCHAIRVMRIVLSECRAFLGTVTSNFGLLVTKLMAFRQPTPISLDLSCKGLTSMRAATDEPGEPVWPIWDELAEDARRSTLAAGCRGQTASKFPGPAHRLRKRLRDVVP